jgi:hypothetical protein
MGAPWVAATLYAFCGIMVLGWAAGEVSWWIGIAALCFASNVGKAVHDVRRYKQWWMDWEAMGNAPGVASPGPLMSNPKKSSWFKIAIAIACFVIIPSLVTAPGADKSLRDGLTLLWLVVATYLFWKIVIKIRRALFRSGGHKATARSSKTAAFPDVVKWTLPPASSSPSRADAIHKLPDYCARLVASR